MVEKISEGVLNLLEMIVRCYDCCLSCSAHITVINKDTGEKIQTRTLKIGFDSPIVEYKE